ncbi:MAG: class I SAM-dependent methyltransferase [Geodermatophilaceae bacterium]
MKERARSFDEVAALYAAARPDYPAEALAWLLPAGALRVLDLGAGTGKLTRQLVDNHLDVVAVEPSPDMGAELSAYVPEAELHQGGAEAIPLPDGSVDAVLVGQAFHWFDHERALPEIARVLRPHGRLGLLWNFDDDSVPWVAAFATATGTTARANQREPAVNPGARFIDAAIAEFPHRQVVDAESLQQLVQTHSFYLVQDEQGRAEVVRRVDEVVSSHPDLVGRESFELPYVTRCWRATRR